VKEKDALLSHVEEMRSIIEGIRKDVSHLAKEDIEILKVQVLSEAVHQQVFTTMTIMFSVVIAVYVLLFEYCIALGISMWIGAIAALVTIVPYSIFISWWSTRVYRNRLRNIEKQIEKLVKGEKLPKLTEL